jgi:hypothetical protein
MHGLLFKSIVQIADVKRFSQIRLTHPAPLEATVHVFKYYEQAASSV